MFKTGEVIFVAENKRISKDEYLFKEGDFPDCMYIVRSGGFAITKTKNKSEVVLAEIGVGAMVGEMALFDSKPRSANVKATKDSEVVALPYKALEQQLMQLPEWIRAIVKTLNQNLRDANLKIKTLGETQAEERFSGAQINKLLAIVNFVGLKYGTKDSQGHVSIPPGILRKYTIQVFHEPTNKMTTLLQALKELKIFEIIDLDDAKQNIINRKPDFLFDFVEWHNEWLMKSEDNRLNLSTEDLKMLKGIVHFALKSPAGSKGRRKINLETVQTNSMVELNYTIRSDNFNFLISKGLCSDKMTAAEGVVVEVIVEELEKMMQYFSLIENMKPLLKQAV